MKTNIIRNEIELHKRIEKLEVENNILKEKNKDYKNFLEILEKWFNDEDRNNNNSINIDCGTYEL